MPNMNVLDIAKEATQNSSKSLLSQALDAITPDVFVNLYHKLAKSGVSLTNMKEITAFNLFISALASFCDPRSPLNIDPEIAACWSIFNYTKITDTTYEFDAPFKFAEINDVYHQRQTIGGRTYWDYPFTSSILAIAAASPAFKEGSTQSLVKLALGYVTSVAVVTASFETESKKYEAVRHLHQVINTLITEEACRSGFDEVNTQILVQMGNRINQFFSVRHAEREAAFIPEAVTHLKCISREISSQLFRILLVVTEGNKNKNLTHDYGRLSQGIVSNHVREPRRLSTSNPFSQLLTKSSQLLNELHDEPRGDEVLHTLAVPEKMYVHKFLILSLILALKHKESWFGKPEHGLLYFFMQKVDLTTHTNDWMKDIDIREFDLSVSKLVRIAYWLKFSLTIASVAKDLNLLLSMEGQRWFARGGDAVIIQQFILKLHSHLSQFKLDLEDLQNYLRARIRSGCGREHHVFKLIKKLSETGSLLLEKGIQPLFNIEEKYLLVADHVHQIRKQFFTRMQMVLQQSQIDIELKLPETWQVTGETPLLETQPTSIIFCKKPPVPDQFLHHELTSRLSHWIEDAFSSKNQAFFLNFWRNLLYVGKEKASKLRHLRHFHQRYRHDIQKLEAQKQLSKELVSIFQSPPSALTQWAGDFLIMVYKNTSDHELFLTKKMSDITASLQSTRKDAEKYLASTLHVASPGDMAWDLTTYRWLLLNLSEKMGLNSSKAGLFLIEIARLLLQTQDVFDPFLSDALDSLLHSALNRLISYVGHEEKKQYWSEICGGLIILGANPLTWMDARMAEKRLVEEDDSHAFYIASQQATLFLSSISYRSRFLGETSLHLKEKFDELVTAIDEFGQRLHSCIEDDSSWWWILFSFFGGKNQGGARLERATLFWAAIRWLYISINEQVYLQEAQSWCPQSIHTLEHYLVASQLYQQKVPHVDSRYNQGFATWQRLETAFKNYCEALMLLASLRHQKEVAIELDKKQLEIQTTQGALNLERQCREEAEARVEKLQENQHAILLRHITLSLNKIIRENLTDGRKKLDRLIDEVVAIHEVTPAQAGSLLKTLILTDEHYLSLREVYFLQDKQGSRISAHHTQTSARLLMFQPLSQTVSVSTHSHQVA